MFFIIEKSEETTFAKLHVPIVTLSTKDKVNLTKQLRDGFKRSVYWNSYQATPAKVIKNGTNIYELLKASFRVIRRLFVLAYFIPADAANNKAGIKDSKRYFLPRREIKNYNALMENFITNQLNSTMD